MKRLRSIIHAGLSVGLLAGCTSGNGLPSSVSALKLGSRDVRISHDSGSPASGTVFGVYSYGSTSVVYVFPPQSAKASMKITKGLGTSAFEPALDSQDNLYVFSYISSNQCQVTVYSPPKYDLVRSISPSGCGSHYSLEPDGNLLFFLGAGSYGCGSTDVAEYSNDGKLLRTLSGFGTTPNVVAADTTGNVYVIGVTETLRSGYCFQSKPGVYVFEPGATKPTYVIRKGLRNDNFQDMAVDSTGYLYVEFQVPNPKKGYQPFWDSVVAYAPGAKTPAYTIRKAPVNWGAFNSYSQDMATFNGELYVAGQIFKCKPNCIGYGILAVYQEHSSKLAYAIKPPLDTYYPAEIAFDHTGTMYAESGGYLSGCSGSDGYGNQSLNEFGLGKKTPLYAMCSFPGAFPAVVW